MSDRKTVDQAVQEISSNVTKNNSRNNDEIDSELEKFLIQSIIVDNNLDLGDYGKNVISSIKLEQVKVIDTELEARLQKLERELILGYELEESKEEKIFETNEGGGNNENYHQDDFEEDYYYENHCHFIDDKPTVVTRDELSYEDCGGNSKSKFNKGYCLLSPAENPEVIVTSSDDAMKYNAFHTPIGLLARCNPSTCPYGGKCINKMTMDDIMDFKVSFWGEIDGDAPSRSTRRLLILNILRNAINRRSKTFQFTFGGRDHDNSLVCEAGFLIALGLSNNPNASKAPSQWINTKKWVLNSYDLDFNKKYSYSEITTNNSKPPPLDKEFKRLKFEDAVAYIIYYAEEFGDKVSSADSGDPDTLVVPFCNLSSFYEEYKIHSLTRQTPVESFAGQTVFSAAYDHLHKTYNIRKLKSKGTFNTCEICNNADTVLQNKCKKLISSQREIIQKFRQLHLIQQSNERRFLDVKKLKASHMDGNRPRAALLFPDFMTEYTCQTPKWDKSSASDMKIDSRLLGIEVYCGPIKTVFIYRIDALIVGGANIMVECVRQALIDLMKLLRHEGLLCPKALWLQFDNCGENKNKQMFAYASILVEDLFFDEVEICFMIVGHTHASIDQYFSIISHKIHSNKTIFIGSPLALLELVRQCHYNKYSQPPVVRDITVYFDVVNAFKPYINNKIKYFQIPHYFIIQRVFGRVSAMQSKILSTGRHLLPQRPDKSVIDKDTMLSSLVNDVPLPTSFAMMDGLDAVKFHLLGYDKVSKTSTISDSDVLNMSVTSEGKVKIRGIDSTTDGAFGNVEKSKLLLIVNKTIPDLENISGLDTVYQQECRMQDEADGLVPKRSYQLRDKVVKKIRNISTSDKGYICWLNLNSKREELTPWSDIIKPEPFNLKQLIEKFVDIKTVVELEEKEAMDCADGEDNDIIILPEISLGAKLSHRDKKTVSRTSNSASEINKSLPSEKRLKRVYIAASNIAKAAKWVLSQVGSKIIVTSNENFDANTFKAVTLTQTEYNWYLDRNSIEKVLSLAEEEFQNADPWEPFPQNKLSAEELLATEREKQKQDELDAEATKLGEALLQRFTDKAKDTDQVISYGPNKNESFIKQISERFQNRRNNSKPKKFYKCDIEICQEIIPDEARCTTCKTTLRFCSSHILHSIHSGRRIVKRRFREQVSVDQFKNQNSSKNVDDERIDDNNNDVSNDVNNDNNCDNNNNIDSDSNSNNDNDNNNNNNNNNNKTSNLVGSESNISNNDNDNIKNDGDSKFKSSNNKDNTLNMTRKINNNKKKKNRIDFEQNSELNNISLKKVRNENVQTVSEISTENNSISNYSNDNLLIFIRQIINTDDSNVENSIISSVYSRLFKDEILFKDVKDSRFKIFTRIRNAVIHGKKEEIVSRIENIFMEWPGSINDLKYLTANIFNLDLNLNYDWKSPDALKNTGKRKEFVREFVKVFTTKYVL